MPLIIETLLLCTLGFLIGVGVAARIATRRRRTSFLDD